LDGEKPTICLEDLESLLQLRGLTLPISSGRNYVLNCAVTKLHHCRHPNVPSYTEQGNHLHSTIFRWRQVKYSCDTSSFTLSGWLVPTLWSLVLISLAVTSAVYVRYSAPYTYPLVEYVPHWYSVGD